MIQTFTQNDLIRYIYQETDEQETRAITEALWEDKELRDQYAELSLVMRSLDGLVKSPPERLTHSILEYSRTLDLTSP